MKAMHPLYIKFVFGFFTLFNQPIFAQSILHFRNKTPVVIDSIVLCNNDCRLIPAIQPGALKSVDIPFAWENTHGVVLCNYRVYFGNHYFNGQRIKGNPADTIDVDYDMTSKRLFSIMIYKNNSSFTQHNFFLRPYRALYLPPDLNL